jgi:hypothetical protein
MEMKIARQVWTAIANRWRKIVSRCSNPCNPDFKNYGGRGIHLWLRWRSRGSGMAEFIKHIAALPVPDGLTLNAALAGRRTRQVSIDRIDNDGDYRPGNLRLVFPAEQSANQRRTHFVTVAGKRMPRTRAARLFGVDPRTAAKRDREGYDSAEAVMLPTGGRTAEARRWRDDLILAMIRGGDLVVDGDGFIFVRTKDGWHLPPVASSKAGKYHGVSITVPTVYLALMPEQEPAAVLPYRSMFQHARVVALYHHGRPSEPQYHETDHINMDPRDDRPENLRWRRPAEHRADAHAGRPRGPARPVDYTSLAAQARALRTFLANASDKSIADAVDDLPLPTNLPDAEVAALIKAVKSDADFSTSIWANPSYASLLPAILAAAANQPGDFAGVVVACRGQTGDTTFTEYVTHLRVSNRVYFACPHCGRQSCAQPTEIRNRVRYHDAGCESCLALDVRSPKIARLVAADPLTGRRPHPSRITVGSNRNVWFRCREDGCTNVVQRRVKPLFKRGEPPVCEAHRMRGKNFNGE